MAIIKSVNVKQAGKFFAFLYGLFSAVIIIPFCLFMIFFSDDVLVYFLFILFLIFYMIIGYFSGAISSFAYYIVAKRFGGIEIDLEDTPQA